VKICKTCNKNKEYSCYRKSKRHKDGFLNECKDCLSIKRREYYLENIDRHKENNKKYYELNKEEIYKNVDKERKRENDKRYQEKNKDVLKLKSKNYYEENKERIKEMSRLYYYRNKDKINEPSDKKRKIRRRSYKKRKHQYIWREILRKTISQLKLDKNQTTFDLLGYTYNELKYHIESKFVEDMGWENHGEWHVDHIVPISKFKKGTPAKIVNDLRNLRPLWSNDNIVRQNKIETIGDENMYLLDIFSDYLIDKV
jgi:hypothetical protein